MYEQVSLLSVPAEAHIDRMTILGKVDNMEMFATQLAANSFILRVKEAKYPYAYAIYCVDGSYIGLASETADVPSFRLDFNPWKKDEYAKAEILKILSKVKNARLSRLDIAIDYTGYDLANVEWLEDRARKRVEIKSGSGRLQTLYMGSFKSDNLIRIYDKGLESGLEYPLWRVEAQMRIKPGIKPFSKNPFEGLYGRASPPGKRPLKEIAVLTYLREHPEEICTLEPHTRSKYRKMMIQEAKENSLTPSPGDVYRKSKGRLSEEAAQWLKECKQSGKRAAVNSAI